MAKVLYPGSFDPMTKGHMNIAWQAADLFDEVVIAVLKNPAKKSGWFTPEERVEIMKELCKEKPNISIIAAEGAAVDIALANGCQAIVRGLRGLSDYDSEVQMQQVNKEISGNRINTVFLFADKEYQFVSSSMVKEVFLLNKDISRYAEPLVIEKMREKVKTLNR